jgi:hypothetical protein
VARRLLNVITFLVHLRHFAESRKWWPGKEKKENGDESKGEGSGTLCEKGGAVRVRVCEGKVVVLN